MRNGRDVGDARDLDAQRVQGADRRFTAGAGALDAHFQRLDAVFQRNAASRFSGDLRGERGRLTRALEASTARRGPRQRVALTVGDGDDGVVERSVNVRDAVRDVLLDLLRTREAPLVEAFAIIQFLDYFFRDAAARRGPLRVRALVRVRWPRTGRPRLWRMPR